MKKNKNGITLIALVITIIVLLILAGISLSLVTGNNGVLTKAKDAESAYKIASAKEQAIMRTAGYVSDYMEKQYDKNDPSIGAMSIGEYVLAQISGKVDGDFAYCVSGNTLTIVNSKTGAVVVIGTINDKGEIIWDESSFAGNGNTGNTGNSGNSGNNGNTGNSQNTNDVGFADPDYDNPIGTDLYGTTVETGVTSVNGIPVEDNWKIFFVDSDFVYLIYGDFYPGEVEYTKVVNGVETEVTGNAQSPATGITLRPIEEQSHSINADTRINLLRYLKNNSSYEITTEEADDSFSPRGDYKSWTDLADAFASGNALARKVKGIQGSPSLKMWATSWNSKHSNPNLIVLFDWVENEGYRIRTQSKQEWSWWVKLYPDDTLYFPHDTETYLADSYWVASPGEEGENSMCSLGYTGDGFSNTNSTAVYICVRPVVSIPRTDYNSVVPNNLKILD